MAKKRKTRQEKIVSDLRRQLKTLQPEQTAVTPAVYSLPKLKTTVSPPINSLPVKRQGESKSHMYAYVISDLKKTILLTTIAIAAQIALYFVLTR